MSAEQRRTVGGVVIEADAAQARSRRETSWAGMAIVAVLLVLGLVYYFYAYVVAPKQQAIQTVMREAERERTNFNGMMKKSESLHEMIELNEVMVDKWAEAVPMFFTDYWDV
ncbi:hypothetical protein IIA16_05675, partial [bacterium]|nr:hypothetical protein [bacterium]